MLSVSILLLGVYSSEMEICMLMKFSMAVSTNFLLLQQNTQSSLNFIRRRDWFRLTVLEVYNPELSAPLASPLVLNEGSGQVCTE